MSLDRSSTVRVLGAAVLAVMVAGTAACSSDSDDGAAPATSETRSFTTADETVEIPSDPQRIVACGYAVLPLIQADANLVGICEWTRELSSMAPDDLATYESLPKLAREADVSTLDYEALTETRPDLIIMGVPARAKEFVDLDALAKLAPVVFLGPTTPAEWRTLGERYADAAGVSEAYGQGRTEYEARAAEMNATWSGELNGVTFGGVCNNCGADPGMFTREYRSSYTTNLFDDLGLEFPGQPADPVDVHAEDLSIESIGQSLGDLDVIVYGVDADGAVPPQLAELMTTAAWKSLPAVQAGNVVPVSNYSAATFETALPALNSIDEALTAIAPRLQ